MIEVLVKEIDTKGSLHVLRHVLKFHGQTFHMAYFKPAHGLNEESLNRFERNELSVTRQAHCQHGKKHDIDLMFALNGIPVTTCELKNPITGQTWENAISQCPQVWDTRASLFRSNKHVLVHLAADTNEVHVTTKPKSDKSRFLPFNRGSTLGGIECGTGNPPIPSGYRTHYFWQEVLERERFLDIIGHYIFAETREEKSEDTGHNYLIQHSAGSGKTISISWLSHRLASLHTDADEKVFVCVIVITDRRVLDRQLQDAIYQIEHAQGVVKPIDQA